MVSACPFFPGHLSSHCAFRVFPWSSKQDDAHICIIQLVAAPDGTLAAWIDIEAAYRTIPIRSEEWCYTVINHNDGFYIDKCLPMGAAMSAGIHGETANMFEGMVKWHGLDEIMKWVDDMVPILVPTGRVGKSFDYRMPVSLKLVDHIAHIPGMPLRKPSQGNLPLHSPEPPPGVFEPSSPEAEAEAEIRDQNSR